MMIPFNKPYMSGRELDNIADAISRGKVSGDGDYSRKCQDFMEKRFGFSKCLLTSSCTDALEMVALLLNILPEDEVIMPSYTFVSTANAFVLRGAKIVFCDSKSDHPGIDEELLEELITTRTKVIVVVHYAGVACNMDAIMSLAKLHGIYIVEDAAQAIDGYYLGRNGRQALGSIGHLATFSFHETKNIISGEGGAIVINDDYFLERAEIIREKGTNRAKFFRGEVDKYNWVDLGSSFLPSDITAAFLYAQLQDLESIQEKRIKIWEQYFHLLHSAEETGLVRRPIIPKYATNNGHMFYLVCESLAVRDGLIATLRENNILSIFHYIALHTSEYYASRFNPCNLPNAELYTERLLRLPLFFELEDGQIRFITDVITRHLQSVLLGKDVKDIG